MKDVNSRIERTTEYQNVGHVEKLVLFLSLPKYRLNDNYWVLSRNETLQSNTWDD